jgi:hypothetical protein
VTSDEERLRDYEGYARATALLDERLGAEDEDAWREYAPDDPHPSVADDQ